MKPIVSGSPHTRRPAALPRRWSWPRRASCSPASRWLLAIRLSLLWQPGGLGRAGGSAPLVAESRAGERPRKIQRLPKQARRSETPNRSSRGALSCGRRHERAKSEGRADPHAWFLGKQERRARPSSRPSRVTRQRVLPRESDTDLSAAFPLPSRPVRCWCRRPTSAHSTVLGPTGDIVYVNRPPRRCCRPTRTLEVMSIAIAYEATRHGIPTGRGA